MDTTNIQSPATIKVQKLVKEAEIPVKATPGAAGFDIFAAENMGISPGETRCIKTGVAIQIPNGFYGKITSRSGLYIKKKVLAFDGTIDADYRGEIFVCLRNENEKAHFICSGDRIAQLVILKLHRANIMESVEELTPSTRGDAGFGSTGM